MVKAASGTLTALCSSQLRLGKGDKRAYPLVSPAEEPGPPPFLVCHDEERAVGRVIIYATDEREDAGQTAAGDGMQLDKHVICK